MVNHGAQHSTSTARSAKKKDTLHHGIKKQVMENHSYWSAMMENGNVSPRALEKKNRFVYDGCRLFMLPGEFDHLFAVSGEDLRIYGFMLPGEFDNF